MADNVKKATKLEAHEAEKMDRSKMGVALVNPPADPDVEAQAQWALVECPWCASVVRIWYYSSVYAWYTCGVCGGAFQA